MPILPHSAAIEAWFDGAANREIGGRYDDCKLDHLRQVLRHLPVPPAPVTVGGTKGKGSTVRFLEMLLLAHGRKTLAFTSPHVNHLAERWRIDGHPVEATILAQACDRVAAAEEGAGTELTYFERGFAVACVLAACRPDTDFLLEVGLGGRLDCANSLDARIVCLTHLSYDHCQVLGSTLELIAREKLAIARAGRHLLIGPQSTPGTLAILRHVPRGVPVRWIQPLPDTVPLGLPGAHQRGNAALALAAAQLLLGHCQAGKITQALGATKLAARCQVVEDPLHHRRFLIDGAHNHHSLAATFEIAGQLLQPGFTVVIGLARDKDQQRIWQSLLPLPPTSQAWRCGYASHRACQPADWLAPANAWPWCNTIKECLQHAPTDRDCLITGSFYLAGEALALLASGPTPPG